MLIFLFAFPVYGQPPEWFLKLRQIKVFESSRQDVERIFNDPKIVYSSNTDGKEKGWGEIIEYQTGNGKLGVFYSTGKCAESDDKTGWDVAENIVVSVEFHPNEPAKLSDFKLDLKTFKAEKAADTQHYSYRSDKLGIEFEVLGGNVTSFEYSPAPERQKLDCRIVLKNKSQ
jgi:hypothetical protein